MTQSHLLEMAQQGDPQAIAELMNQSLQPRGMTATVERQGDCLNVLLEAEQVPNRQTLTEFVKRGISTLGVPSIRSVKVLGQQTGTGFPVWSQELALELPMADLEAATFEDEADLTNGAIAPDITAPYRNGSVAMDTPDTDDLGLDALDQALSEPLNLGGAPADESLEGLWVATSDEQSQDSLVDLLSDGSEADLLSSLDSSSGNGSDIDAFDFGNDLDNDLSNNFGNDLGNDLGHEFGAPVDQFSTSEDLQSLFDESSSDNSMGFSPVMDAEFDNPLGDLQGMFGSDSIEASFAEESLGQSPAAETADLQALFGDNPDGDLDLFNSPAPDLLGDPEVFSSPAPDALDADLQGMFDEAEPLVIPAEPMADPMADLMADSMAAPLADPIAEADDFALFNDLPSGESNALASEFSMPDADEADILSGFGDDSDLGDFSGAIADPTPNATFEQFNQLDEPDILSGFGDDSDLNGSSLPETPSWESPAASSTSESLMDDLGFGEEPAPEPSSNGIDDLQDLFGDTPAADPMVGLDLGDAIAPSPSLSTDDLALDDLALFDTAPDVTPEIAPLGEPQLGSSFDAAFGEPEVDSFQLDAIELEAPGDLGAIADSTQTSTDDLSNLFAEEPNFEDLATTDPITVDVEDFHLEEPADFSPESDLEAGFNDLSFSDAASESLVADQMPVEAAADEDQLLDFLGDAPDPYLENNFAMNGAIAPEDPAATEDDQLLSFLGEEPEEPDFSGLMDEPGASPELGELEFSGMDAGIGSEMDAGMDFGMEGDRNPLEPEPEFSESAFAGLENDSEFATSEPELSESTLAGFGEDSDFLSSEPEFSESSFAELSSESDPYVPFSMADAHAPEVAPASIDNFEQQALADFFSDDPLADFLEFEDTALPISDPSLEVPPTIPGDLNVDESEDLFGDVVSEGTLEQSEAGFDDFAAERLEETSGGGAIAPEEEDFLGLGMTPPVAEEATLDYLTEPSQSPTIDFQSEELNTLPQFSNEQDSGLDETTDLLTQSFLEPSTESAMPLPPEEPTDLFAERMSALDSEFPQDLFQDDSEASLEEAGLEAGLTDLTDLSDSNFLDIDSIPPGTESPLETLNDPGEANPLEDLGSNQPIVSVGSLENLFDDEDQTAFQTENFLGGSPEAEPDLLHDSQAPSWNEAPPNAFATAPTWLEDNPAETSILANSALDSDPQASPDLNALGIENLTMDQNLRLAPSSEDDSFGQVAYPSLNDPMEAPPRAAGLPWWVYPSVFLGLAGWIAALVLGSIVMKNNDPTLTPAPEATIAPAPAPAPSVPAAPANPPAESSPADNPPAN
ncbi:MAG: hypothetical protein MUF49_03390 [Oculatellaceae cyanobacterium Prado106]|nr:hypothetical protein [Oculatellaceae cyanobacterium Prado106]